MTAPKLLEVEEWRQIPGHDSYSASSLGRIKCLAHAVSGVWRGAPCTRRVRERIVVGCVHRNGYRTHTLPNPAWVEGCGAPRHRHYCTNRLVYAAFYRLPNDDEEIDHGDLVRDNNRPGNLTAMTVAQNRAKRVPKRGEKSHYAKLSESQVRDIRRRLQSETQTAIAAEYGVSRSAVTMIAKRQTWAHVL